MTDPQRKLLVFVVFVIGFGAAVWAAYADPADTVRSTTGQTVFFLCWLVIIWYVVTERQRRKSLTEDPDEEI